MKSMKTDLLSILNDRIDRLHRHGRFEECAIAERTRELLFPINGKIEQQIKENSQGEETK